MSRAGQPLKSGQNGPLVLPLTCYSGVGYLCFTGEYGLFSGMAKSKSVMSTANFSFAARARRLTANERSVTTRGAMSCLP
jgi:hypothetical protein